MREPDEKELHTYYMERFSVNCMLLFENIGEYIEDNHIVAKHSEWITLAEIASQALFELHRCVIVTGYDRPIEIPDLKFLEKLASNIEVKDRCEPFG